MVMFMKSWGKRLCAHYQKKFMIAPVCLDEYTIVDIRVSTLMSALEVRKVLTSCIIFQTYLRHFYMYRDTVERV